MNRLFRSLVTNASMKHPANTPLVAYNPPMHKNAELYDTCSEMQVATGRQSLANYARRLNTPLEELKIKGRVIDIGCGQGAVTNFLTEYLDKSATLDCADISEDVMEYAREKYRLDKANFIVFDATAPVTKEMKGNYDFVFSNALLHWVTDHRTVFNNFSELLKPERKCLVSFFSYMALFDAFKDVSNIPKWSSFMDDVEKYIPHYIGDNKYVDTLEGIIKNAGFDDVTVDVEDLDYCGKLPNYNLSDIKALIQGVDPFILRMPKHLHNLYLDDLIDSFHKFGGIKKHDKSPHGDGGIVEFRAQMFIAIGTKK